jgi:hypothetical protein
MHIRAGRGLIEDSPMMPMTVRMVSGETMVASLRWAEFQRRRDREAEKGESRRTGSDCNGSKRRRAARGRRNE